MRVRFSGLAADACIKVRDLHSHVTDMCEMAQSREFSLDCEHAVFESLRLCDSSKVQHLMRMRVTATVGELRLSATSSVATSDGSHSHELEVEFADTTNVSDGHIHAAFTLLQRCTSHPLSQWPSMHTMPKVRTMSRSQVQRAQQSMVFIKRHLLTR